MDNADNLARARALIERARTAHVPCPQAHTAWICADCAAVALAAAVRAKGEEAASQTVERDLGRSGQDPLTAWELREAIRAHAADVPEVPRAS